MSKHVTLYALAFLLPSIAAHAGGLGEEWVEPGAVIHKERCPYAAGIFSDNPACVPPSIGKASKGIDPGSASGKGGDGGRVGRVSTGNDPGPNLSEGGDGSKGGDPVDNPGKDPGKGDDPVKDSDKDDDPGKDPGKGDGPGKG